MPFLEALGPVVTLSAFLVFCAAVATNRAYRATLGAALQLLIRLFANVSAVPIVGGFFAEILTGPLKALDDAILDGLAYVINSTEQSWHQWWKWTAQAFYAIGDAERYAAHQTLAAFRILRRSTIPNLVTGAVALVEHPLRFALATLRSEQATAARVIRQELTAVERAAALTERVALARIARLEHEAANAGAAAIAVTLPQIHGLERETGALEKWVRAHAKELTVAGITSAVVAAVSTEFSWLRCNNTKSLARHLCSWPIKLFEDLLGGVLDYLVLSNLCFLLTEMEKLSLRMLPFIEDATGIIDELIGCQQSTIAEPVPLAYQSKITPWVTLPA